MLLFYDICTEKLSTLFSLTDNFLPNGILNISLRKIFCLYFRRLVSQSVVSQTDKLMQLKLSHLGKMCPRKQTAHATPHPQLFCFNCCFELSTGGQLKSDTKVDQLTHSHHASPDLPGVWSGIPGTGWRSPGYKTDWN